MTSLHHSFLQTLVLLDGGCYGFFRSGVDIVAGGLHAVGGEGRQVHRYRGNRTYLSFVGLMMGCALLMLCCWFLLV